jgi:hypothetical protein
MTTESEIAQKLNVFADKCVKIRDRCIYIRQYPAEFVRLYYFHILELRRSLNETLALYNEVLSMRPELYMMEMTFDFNAMSWPLKETLRQNTELLKEYRYFEN